MYGFTGPDAAGWFVAVANLSRTLVALLRWWNDAARWFRKAYGDATWFNWWWTNRTVWFDVAVSNRWADGWQHCDSAMRLRLANRTMVIVVRSDSTGSGKTVDGTESGDRDCGDNH